MKKGNEFRELLPELEKLPEETREGVVSFLDLVVAVDRARRSAHLQGGELEEGTLKFVPRQGRGDGVVQDFRELLRLLRQRLQGQRPERRDLVLAVLAASGKAYEVGEESSGRLLLQIAIIMTAGEEDAASAEIRDIVGTAALAIAKTQAH